MRGVHCDISLILPHGFESVLLCRTRHRLWLTALDESHDVTIPMDLSEASFEMDGEVTFRRDPKTNITKAVSGTEWMCRKRTLEIGRWVSMSEWGRCFNHCG